MVPKASFPIVEWRKDSIALYRWSGSVAQVLLDGDCRAVLPEPGTASLEGLLVKKPLALNRGHAGGGGNAAKGRVGHNCAP